MKTYTCTIEVKLKAADAKQAEELLFSLMALLHAQPNVFVPYFPEEEE